MRMSASVPASAVHALIHAKQKAAVAARREAEISELALKAASSTPVLRATVVRKATTLQQAIVDAEATIKTVARKALTELQRAALDVSADAHYYEHRTQYAKDRRLTLHNLGCCINGEHHDKPWNGHIRCQWCVWVHRYGARRVARMVARKVRGTPNPPRPPRYGTARRR